MARKWMVRETGLLKILFVLVVLFLCIADSQKHPASQRHPAPHNRDEIMSKKTVRLHPTVAVPVVCTCPESADGTNASVTESTDTLNATTGTSNTTDSPDSTSPETPPSDPKCLQGWAVFLICLGAVLTVSLLAGIPMMVYCILQARQPPPQTCPLRYNRNIYTTPEEQTFQLE